MAAVTGPPAAVADTLGSASLPEQAQVVGPVPAGADAERMLIRVPRAQGAELARALKAAAALRSARKAADPVRIVLDPLELI